MIKELLDTPWVSPVIAAVIAAALAVLVHYLGAIVLRRVTRSMTVLNSMLVHIRRPALFLLPLIAIALVWQASPDDLHLIDKIRHFNGLLVIAEDGSVDKYDMPFPTYNEALWSAKAAAEFDAE